MHCDFRLVATISVLLIWPVSAAGAAEMNTAAGKQLAKEWCKACHIVEKGQINGTSTAAPTFFHIAGNPATTEMSLRAFFATPHEQMPNFQLTNQQTDDIIAYILSLREP
jgi:mono/diheme cytochrome c family protein